MKKIIYLFVCMLSTLIVVGRVSAKVVCENTGKTIGTITNVSINDVAKISKVSDVSVPFSSITKCEITISSGETYYDDIQNNEHECNIDSYAIVHSVRSDYKIVRKVCKDSLSAYDTDTISCGNVKGIPKYLTAFSRNVVKVIKALIAVILIVLGIIDMFKASTASDAKVSKESVIKLARRVIAAILVFFAITFVQFIIHTIANASKKAENGDIQDNTNNMMTCLSCFISNGNDCVEDNYFDEDSEEDGNEENGKSESIIDVYVKQNG